MGGWVILPPTLLGQQTLPGPSAQLPKHAVIVNKAAFDALGARTQAALQTAGAEAPTGLYGPANSVDCAITPPRPAMPTKPFQVPKTILGVIATVDVSEALDADDPRFVQTQEARGSQKTQKRLATKFGLDLATRQLLAPTQKHVLFFGHIGSGKTTQLRQYAKQFSQTGRLFVVEVNVVDHLDPYDLQYTETLVLMAQTLLERLHAQGVAVDGSHLSKLQAWFSGRIQTQEMARDLSLEVKSGGELGVGIPLVARMFSAITTAFKTNASYKDTLRTEVRNSFKDFAAIFNELLGHKALAQQRIGALKSGAKNRLGALQFAVYFDSRAQVRAGFFERSTLGCQCVLIGLAVAFELGGGLHVVRQGIRARGLQRRASELGVDAF